jgi:transcriptional regulator of acetoin/glycerol metabolism
MHAMQAYKWPGNIRELVNVIERGVILAQTDRFVLELPNHAHKAALTTQGHSILPAQTWQEIEREALIAALVACRGKIFGEDGAAARLSLKPTTLTSKIAKHQINRHAYVLSAPRDA